MERDLQQQAEAYKLNPTDSGREQLILAGVPYVRSVVGRIAVPDHPLAHREDLETAGVMGLMHAIDAYDPGHGTPFVSYIYGRVRGAIVDYLRSIDALPREQRRRLAEAEKARAQLAQAFGAEPDDQDVADFLGISLAEYHQLLVRAQNRFSLSLNHPAGDDEEQTLSETLYDEDAAAVDANLEKESTLAYVQQLIRTLPERDQVILALYHFENLTLREIGQVLDLTEARISQLLAKIHLRIRLKLEEPTSLAA